MIAIKRQTCIWTGLTEEHNESVSFFSFDFHTAVCAINLTSCALKYFDFCLNVSVYLWEGSLSIENTRKISNFYTSTWSYIFCFVIKSVKIVISKDMLQKEYSWPLSWRSPVALSSPSALSIKQFLWDAVLDPPLLLIRYTLTKLHIVYQA